MIDEDLEESNDRSSHLEQDEWKIRWAQLRIVDDETLDQAHRVGKIQHLKRKVTHQLHHFNLRFVFQLDHQPTPDDRQSLIVWLYEIPGHLGPRTSVISNPAPDQETSQDVPLVDPTLKTVHLFDHPTCVTKQLTIQACITVLSHGVLSHSQLFPKVFTRSKTLNPKPFLPHLSHPAKNRTGNDFLQDDPIQTNMIPAYANLLRVLNQYIITLAVRSPDSTAFSGASPTRWIRWGSDRLLSVPRDESLESLYRNLHHDSTRLFGAILATPPALIVELKCWLSSRVAMCQPSFTARRFAPMPTFHQHCIPPGFPLILAPFPNLRAQFVRMFGRFDHHSIARSKARLSSHSPFQAGRSSSSWDPFSATDAAWLSRQKKICRAELKHFEKLKQTWHEAVPLMEPFPEPHQAAPKNSNQRTPESWVVCKVFPGACDDETQEGSEIELVWPIDHCLLDLETWIAKAEPNLVPSNSEQPAHTDRPPVPACKPGLFHSRARMANSLLLSTYASTDELAEDAGSYIDWVAQEREHQRRVAAVASKDLAKEKTASPPSMMSTRVGLGYNRGRSSSYLSPRFQRHASTSAARASPVPTPTMMPHVSRKRQREEGEDSSGLQTTATSIPYDNGITPIVAQSAKDGSETHPSAQFSHPAIQQLVPAESFMSLANADQPLANATTQSSNVALAHQMVTSTSQFVSAQQGSGTGSTTSTISYNTNLFEQPTPGSVSISGLTPGHLNGFTPDGTTHNFNPPSVQTVLQSSPTHQSRHLNPESSLQSQSDPVVNSENAFRTLSLVQPNRSTRPARAFSIAEPAGYESVQFSHSHSVVDEHYTRRGGKYALPPSPCSFTAPEDEQEDGIDVAADQESLSGSRGSSLVHVSKTLMLAMDPRAKAIRGLSNNLIPSPRMSIAEPPQPPYNRVMPLTNSIPIPGPSTYNDTPATPRSWIPLGSPSDSPVSSTCSDDEGQSESNRCLHANDARESQCSRSTTTSTSDDETLMEADDEYHDEMMNKMKDMDYFLNKVLEFQYRSHFSCGLEKSIVDDRKKKRKKADRSAEIPKVIKSSMKQRLKNWVSQLGAQLEHDPNLEILLETVLPSCSSRPTRNVNKSKTVERRSGSETVLDSASLPMVHGLDYYRPRIDDRYEIQENRKKNVGQQEKDEHEDDEDDEDDEGDGKEEDKEDESDQMPYLIKNSSKRPTSIIVKMNDGKQKITFSLISQLFKYWIKFGFEPIGGQRDFTLSIIFPKPTRNLEKNPNLNRIDQQQSSQSIQFKQASIKHWLTELAQTYKCLKLGELSIGKIHDSKYRSKDLKIEIEEMIREMRLSSATRHTCLIVVDKAEEMKGLMIGENQIKGLDGRPVTRLIVSRNQLTDDQPASLLSFALRLYDSMKISVDRFKAPGLVLRSCASQPLRPEASGPTPIVPSSDLKAQPDRLDINLLDSSSDSDYESDGQDSTEAQVGSNDEDSTIIGEAGRLRPKAQVGKRRRKRQEPDDKLLSGHAFSLSEIPRPTQFNLRWPPSGIDVGARHRLLHTGYLVGPRRSWVLVSTVDELGQQHQLILKFLNPTRRAPQRRRRREERLEVDSLAAKQSQPEAVGHTHDNNNSNDDDDDDDDDPDYDFEMQIAKSVWQVFREILLSTNVEWKIVITKLGRLKPVEYQAWCELLSQILPASELAFHVTLASVMLTDVPLLKRVPHVIDSPINTNTHPETVEGPDLEMGEVDGTEEGEESNNPTKIEDGSDRLFEGPEPIWVSHESTIRPHSIYSDQPQFETDKRLPSSVNETIVHCLSTSYFYHLDCPTRSGIENVSSLYYDGSGQMNYERNMNAAGGRFRLDILGTGSTQSSVYQSNLFDHREEIIESIIQLSKLKSIRMGLQPINNSHNPSARCPSYNSHLSHLPAADEDPSPDRDLDLGLEEDVSNPDQVQILPVHLSSLKIIGDRLALQFDQICDILRDDEHDHDQDNAPDVLPQAQGLHLQPVDPHDPTLPTRNSNLLRAP